VVLHGETRVMPDEDGTDPYEIPKKKGIFKVVPSGNFLTTHDIVERIIKNRCVQQLDIILSEDMSLLAMNSLYEKKGNVGYQYSEA